MNKIHKTRMLYVVIFCAGLTLAASLILFALRQNINVFLTPSQMAEKSISPYYQLRLGGMVKENSMKRDAHSLQVSFVVTDFKKDVLVVYHGVLPDLFREGKGVIAEGRLKNKVFVATSVLAKHDENYMPKNVYEKLRANLN